MNNASPLPQSVCQLVSTLMLSMLAAVVFFTTDAHALHYYYRQLPVTGYKSGGALLLDKSGNMYGTTLGGGDFQSGSVFEYVRIDSYWSYQTIYSFCSKPNCKDGAGGDYGKLVMDTKGNLYGLTIGRTPDVPGNAYELMPRKDGSWRIKILHTFCGWNDANCKDGFYPASTLTYSGASTGAPYDGISPLYGTTKVGGQFGQGTVFSLMPPAGKGRWAEKVLYSFCMQGQCVDGSQPVEVTADSKGSLFGTTASGGVQNGGTAFELSPNSDLSLWTEHIIASFYSQPSSGLTFDPSGNAYGVTLHGGSGYCDNLNKTGCGSLYELHLNADGNFDLRYLVAFCNDKRCNGGAFPAGDLTIDAAGNLYGVATGDFFGDYSADFALLKTGFKSLHSFCPYFDCNNASADPGLTMDPEGNFFGTVGGVGYEVFHK